MASEIYIPRKCRWCTGHGSRNAPPPKKPTTNAQRQWMVSNALKFTHMAYNPWILNKVTRIETLLEEAYNERMHLLTFLQLAQPTPLMRFMVLGAQCVFFTGFSVAYLISPQICHRFVGYLEEEAVITYSKAIQDLDNGRLPRWESLRAPDMAVRYWEMPVDQRCMRSLLLYVRADEAKHCEVNHTLGNLDQNLDMNPFSVRVGQITKGEVKAEL